MTPDRLSRAVACLRGLAVGDAIGACYFIPDNQPLRTDRVLPPDPWYWTDDTEMACSIVTTLAEHGGIAVPGGQDGCAALPSWVGPAAGEISGGFGWTR